MNYKTILVLIASLLLFTGCIAPKTQKITLLQDKGSFEEELKTKTSIDTGNRDLIGLNKSLFNTEFYDKSICDYYRDPFKCKNKKFNLFTTLDLVATEFIRPSTNFIAIKNDVNNSIKKHGLLIELNLRSKTTNKSYKSIAKISSKNIKNGKVYLNISKYIKSKVPFDKNGYELFGITSLNLEGIRNILINEKLVTNKIHVPLFFTTKNISFIEHFRNRWQHKHYDKGTPTYSIDNWILYNQGWYTKKAKREHAKYYNLKTRLKYAKNQKKLEKELERLKQKKERAFTSLMKRNDIKEIFNPTAKMGRVCNRLKYLATSDYREEECWFKTKKYRTTTKSQTCENIRKRLINRIKKDKVIICDKSNELYYNFLSVVGENHKDLVKKQIHRPNYYVNDKELFEMFPYLKIDLKEYANKDRNRENIAELEHDRKQYSYILDALSRPTTKAYDDINRHFASTNRTLKNLSTRSRIYESSHRKYKNKSEKQIEKDIKRKTTQVKRTNDSRIKKINSYDKQYKKKINYVSSTNYKKSSKKSNNDSLNALAFCWQNAKTKKYRCDSRTQISTISGNLNTELRNNGCKNPSIAVKSITLNNTYNEKIGSKTGTLYKCSNILKSDESQGQNTWNRNIRKWWAGIPINL